MEHAFTIPFFHSRFASSKKKSQIAEINENEFLLKRIPSISFDQQPHVLIENRFRFDSEHQYLKYLPHIAFESDDLFQDVILFSKKAKAEDLIPPERIWMGIYFDLELQQHTHPKVSIRFVDETIGFGVFAEERIRSCAFMGEYSGILRSRRNSSEKKHSLAYTIWDTRKKKFTLDAERQGNFTRFINHSKKPNLSLQSIYWRGVPRVIFIALRNISEGEQLTFDYGASFWKESGQIPQEL